MDRRFLAILGAIIVIFVGIFAITSHSSNNGSSGKAGVATNHQEGSNSSGVVLVEYGDYQCPVCGLHYQPLKQVVSQFSQQIIFQFRNLPLTSLHPNAFAAARAAEAAGLQGKYWEMHDLLYQQNVAYNVNHDSNTWVTASDPVKYFDQYAKNIGLNVSQFDSDYASGKVNDAINADLAAFDKTGQEKGTPSYFLDGKFITNSKVLDANGEPSVDKFASLINAEISAKAKH